MNRFLYIFLLFCCLASQAQEVLQVRRVRFNRMKVTEISRGDILEYKLKGESHYRKNEIVGLHDSSIVFANNVTVMTNQVKTVKLHQLPHMLVTLKKVLLYAGVGFVLLDTGNNLIIGRDQVVNNKALIISACLLSGALVLEELSIKRLRMNSRNSLRVLDAEYYQFK